ncbi:MAG: MarR family winged helix-turn-helix transcriptional regulator [Spirochaetia bacterium]
MKKTGDEYELILADICRIHHRAVHALLENFGLYRGQPPLLHRLWEKDGRTHNELAESLHITPATVSRMIRRLEKNGFLRRQSDPSDERISRVFLTQRGKDVEKEVKAALADLDRRAFGGFSRKERDDLLVYLARIKENLMNRSAGKE